MLNLDYRDARPIYEQVRDGKPLVCSAQPNTRFAFVRLHRACYPLTERRCSP